MQQFIQDDFIKCHANPSIFCVNLKFSFSICSEDGKPHEIETKLETIEQMIRDTRIEMKEYMSTSTIANSTTSAEPLNTSVASSMISSTDSRHMLDDNVIHR